MKGNEYTLPTSEKWISLVKRFFILSGGLAIFITGGGVLLGKTSKEDDLKFWQDATKRYLDTDSNTFKTISGEFSLEIDPTTGEEIVDDEDKVDVLHSIKGYPYLTEKGTFTTFHQETNGEKYAISTSFNQENGKILVTKTTKEGSRVFIEDKKIGEIPSPPGLEGNNPNSKKQAIWLGSDKVALVESESNKLFNVHLVDLEDETNTTLNISNIPGGEPKKIVATTKNDGLAMVVKKPGSHETFVVYVDLSSGRYQRLSEPKNEITNQEVFVHGESIYIQKATTTAYPTNPNITLEEWSLGEDGQFSKVDSVRFDYPSSEKMPSSNITNIQGKSPVVFLSRNPDGSFSEFKWEKRLGEGFVSTRSSSE